MLASLVDMESGRGVWRVVRSGGLGRWSEGKDGHDEVRLLGPGRLEGPCARRDGLGQLGLLQARSQSGTNENGTCIVLEQFF